MEALGKAGLYLDFATKAFRQRLAYRTDVLMGVARSFLILFVQVSVWRALLAARPAANGITMQDMVTYIIVGMMLNSLSRSRIDLRIAQRMEDGSIACDFVRPVNFKYYMMSEDIGENVFSTLFTTLPACLLGMLYWGVRFPENPISFLLFLASVAGGMAVIYYLNYTTGLLLFWFKTAHFLDWFFWSLQNVFSGGTVPLWFYPPALRAVSQAFPWQLISFAPLAIFLEKCTIAEAVRVLFLQAAWFIALVLLERVLWRKAQQKIEVFGG